MNDLLPSDALIDFLRWWEGLPGGVPALTAYADQAGVPTIGYGHTANVQMGDTCTAADAEQWLASEAAHFMGCAMKMVSIQLSQQEADACGSLTFNIGTRGFAMSRVLSLLNHNSVTAAAGAFYNWRFATINGAKVEDDGLKKRRLAEIDIFNNGNYDGHP